MVRNDFVRIVHQDQVIAAKLLNASRDLLDMLLGMGAGVAWVGTQMVCTVFFGFLATAHAL